MAKSPLWLRLTAPCLALALGGGYVWIRHKKAEAAEVAALAAEQPGGTAVLPGSKAPWGVVDLKLLKSRRDFDREAQDGRESGADKKIPPPLPANSTKPYEDENGRIVLPSSKSGGILHPEDFKQGESNRNNIDEVLNNPR